MLLIYYGLGAICIGVLFTVIGIRVLLLRGRMVAVCLTGRTTIGRVVGVDRGKTGHVRLRLAFSTADGRELEYLEPIAVRAKVGDQLRVRYRATKPEVATSSRLRHLLGELLVFGIVFALGGMAMVISALTEIVWGSEDLFYGLFGVGALTVVAAVLIFISLQSYAKARTWRRRIVADGVVERVEPREDDGGYARPWIAYETADGRRLEYQDAGLSGCAPGEKVPVYYDPDHPEFTSTGVDRSATIELAIFTGGAGLLFAAWAAYSAWQVLSG
jgi:Protein of unknown function (DUF3592)